MTNESTNTNLRKNDVYIPNREGAIVTPLIANGSVTGDKLGSDITILAVPDDVTIELNGSDELAVKDGGIDTTQLADEGVTDAKLSTATAALIALIAAIPTTDPAVAGQCWFDTGVLVVSNGP